MIQIPDAFKSSKGDGSLSRSIKGAIGLVIALGVAYTGLDETNLTLLANAILAFSASAYTLYGVVMKIYNKMYNDKK